MKYLYTLIVLLFSFLIQAQNGAKIEILAKNNTIDYGEVIKGKDNGIRSFEFKNIGDKPLIINNVQSTCGCTIPEFPKSPVLPGKTDFIKIKYNMKVGPIRKTITVETNAVNFSDGRVVLKIEGEVIQK